MELPKDADIRKHKLSKMEWNVLKDFELILEVYAYCFLLSSGVNELCTRYPIRLSWCFHQSVFQLCASIWQLSSSFMLPGRRFVVIRTVPLSATTSLCRGRPEFGADVEKQDLTCEQSCD